MSEAAKFATWKIMSKRLNVNSFSRFCIFRRLLFLFVFIFNTINHNVSVITSQLSTSSTSPLPTQSSLLLFSYLGNIQMGHANISRVPTFLVYHKLQDIFYAEHFLFLIFLISISDARCQRTTGLTNLANSSFSSSIVASLASTTGTCLT